MGDWSKYPTSDLDLYLSGPADESITAATLNSPEGAVIDTPTLGPWTIEVEAYLIYTPRELYRIRVTTNP